jgi:hypothetical protein
MRNKLLISMAVLAVAIATAACNKMPSGETNQDGSVKSEAAQPKSTAQPQQRSDQTRSQAVPGQTEQASQSRQGAAGPAVAEQETKSTQAAAGATEQASKSGQVAPAATEQEAKSQAVPGGAEQETGQHAAKPGEDRNAKNNSLGQPNQQNRTVEQSDGGASERTAAQPNQPQRDQAQLNEPPNRSGQSQQARLVNPGQEQGNGASGALNLSRDKLRQVQMVLKEKGFDVGTVDGVLGPRTRNALLAFQRRHGLEVTGKIDQPTMTALGVSNPADPTTGQSGAGTER